MVGGESQPNLQKEDWSKFYCNTWGKDTEDCCCVPQLPEFSTVGGKQVRGTRKGHSGGTAQFPAEALKPTETENIRVPSGTLWAGTRIIFILITYCLEKIFFRMWGKTGLQSRSTPVTQIQSQP